MPSAQSNLASDANRFELDPIGIVRRRWKHLTLGLLMGIGLAALYHQTAEPIYESNVEVLIGQRSSEMTTSGTASTATASGDAIQVDQLATHMQLFTSRRTIGEAIEKHNLAAMESFQKAIKKDTHPIDHVLNNLDIQRGGKGSARDAMVIRATFRDTSAENAASILFALYESYRNYVETHAREGSDEAIKLIQDAQVTHENELVDADREFREFIATVPVLMEGDVVQDIHKDRLQRLEQDLNSVKNSLASSRSRMLVIEAYLANQNFSDLGDTAHLALMSEKEVARLQLFLDITRGQAQSEAFQAEQPAREESAKARYNKLLNLLQTERILEADYGASHPLVAATRKEIEVIREFIEENAPITEMITEKKLDPKEMLRTYVMLLKNDIAELTMRESILLADSDKELRAAKDVQSSYLQGMSLKARLNRAQSRYDELIRRLAELNLAGSYAGFSTDLLSNPEVALEPAWPKLSIVLAIGCIMGLFMGGFIAVVTDMLDSTFHSPADLESALGANAVAHISKIDFKQVRRVMGADSKLHPSLVAFHAPRSPASELYRVARTSIMVKNRNSGAQKLMMTSPLPGDGKSTTISNLAISFAQVGKRVLLIDADMRRPVIDGLFGIHDRPGLADALGSSTDIGRCLHVSEVENLTIMPHGIRTAEPAELLESSGFASLLMRCEKRFDLILIDAPPLLAVADPVIIGPQVDGVILTVRIRKNGRRPVERAGQILREVGIEPTALIVNSLDKVNQAGYGYSRGYYADEYSYVDYHKEYSSDKVDRRVRKLDGDKNRNTVVTATDDGVLSKGNPV